MTITEKLKEIARLAFGDQVPPAAPAPTPETTAPAKMESVTTLDGTVLEIDKKEVGGTVLIGGVAAPDAKYSLEGGTTLTVVGGLIAEIETEPVPAAPAGHWHGCACARRRPDQQARAGTSNAAPAQGQAGQTPSGPWTRP